MTAHKTNNTPITWKQRCLRGIGFTLLTCFMLSIGTVVLYKFVPIHYTPLMLIRSCEALKNGKKVERHHQWTPIEQISPNMVRAVIASEDNLFLQHKGFSFKQIQLAIKEKQSGKRIRGGSTISQQTAKNAFLTPSKTYLRKALEAYFTILIEIIWGKERIMEVYLNIIEMGDGIYGVAAASEIYFHTTPKQLTSSQSALIAVCLPNPRRMSPEHPSSYVRKRQTQILKLMPKLGKIDLQNTKE